MPSVKKSRLTRLIEAVREKRWADANTLVAHVLEQKVMARLAEEREEVFKECPLDGDGGSPMSNPPKKKVNEASFGMRSRFPDKPGVSSGFTKKAILREPDAKPGEPSKLHVDCVCGNRVDMGMSTDITGKGGTCSKCGQKYDSRGWLKEDHGAFKSCPKCHHPMSVHNDEGCQKCRCMEIAEEVEDDKVKSGRHLETEDEDDDPVHIDIVKGDHPVNESAPKDMEPWVKKNKSNFKKEYGAEKGEKVLYATANKHKGEHWGS